MNRSAAHTALVRQILAAVGSLPGVIVGDNPCGVARYPRPDYPTKFFAVPYGWPYQKGSPDVLIAVFGVMLAVEVKTGAGKLTADQRVCRDALRAAGVRVIEARRVEDVVHVVEEMRRGAA